MAWRASDATAGSQMRRQEYSKSLAVTGVPSLHLALSRRWNVYVRPSSDTSQLSATPGSKPSAVG